MDWESDADPQLGDVTREQHSARWYVVAGIEEHRDSPQVWWLTLERIDEDRALLLLGDPEQRVWEHTRYRR
jgi:hypothetical protein